MITEFESSSIKEFKYLEEDKELYVRMKNNNIVYVYKHVPMSLYSAFIKAPSKGKFFLTEIKGKYEYDKITH